MHPTIRHQPSRIIPPPRLDPATISAVNAMGTTIPPFTDAVSRLQEDHVLDRPPPHQASSIRLAAAAAHGMVAGLFGGNQSNTPSISVTSSQHSLVKSASAGSLMSRITSSGDYSDDEEYIYPGGTIPMAARGPQLPPLRNYPRRLKLKPLETREEPPVVYTSFPDFDKVTEAAAAAKQQTNLQAAEEGSDSSSAETDVYVSHYARKGNWKGKYNYRRVRDIFAGADDEEDENQDDNRAEAGEGEDQDSRPSTPQTIVKATLALDKTPPMHVKAEQGTVKAAKMLVKATPATSEARATIIEAAPESVEAELTIVETTLTPTNANLTIVKVAPTLVKSELRIIKATLTDIQATAKLTTTELYPSPCSVESINTPVSSPEPPAHLPLHRRPSSYDNTASSAIRIPPPSPSGFTRSVGVVIYKYGAENPAGITSHSSPKTYKLGNVDGYVSFPPFVESEGPSGSTSSLVEAVEEKPVRKKLLYLTPVRKRDGGASFPKSGISSSARGHSALSKSNRSIKGNLSNSTSKSGNCGIVDNSAMKSGNGSIKGNSNLKGGNESIECASNTAGSAKKLS